MANFRNQLTDLINCHSLENGSDTPDYILAAYLDGCRKEFDAAVNARARHSSEQEVSTEKADNSDYAAALEVWGEFLNTFVITESDNKVFPEWCRKRLNSEKPNCA